MFFTPRAFLLFAVTLFAISQSVASRPDHKLSSRRHDLKAHNTVEKRDVSCYDILTECEAGATATLACCLYPSYQAGNPFTTDVPACDDQYIKNDDACYTAWYNNQNKASLDLCRSAMVAYMNLDQEGDAIMISSCPKPDAQYVTDYYEYQLD